MGDVFTKQTLKYNSTQESASSTHEPRLASKQHHQLYLRSTLQEYLYTQKEVLLLYQISATLYLDFNIKVISAMPIAIILKLGSGDVIKIFFFSNLASVGWLHLQ